MEAAGPLPPYSNLLLRLEIEAGEEKAPELYAKVVRPLEGSTNRCYIHFTSVPPAVRARLNRLAGQVETP
jgi:hypothetical protein